MATPGQLVEAVAMTLGISTATVAQFDRQLSESGLRSKSGRGSSAAKVTPSDAANLLISILAAPVAGSSIKNAARTCAIYGALPIETFSRKDGFSKFGLRKLDELPNEHCLLEALSTAIEGVMSGEVITVPRLPKGLNVEWGDDDSRLLDEQFSIVFDAPRPSAVIKANDTFFSRNWPTVGAWVYESVSVSPPGRRSLSKRRATVATLAYYEVEVEAPEPDETDFHQERRITFTTIRVLGSLLSDSAKAR
jgi:hypothetical protein